MPDRLFATDKRQNYPRGRLMDVQNYKKLPPKFFDFGKISKIYEKMCIFKKVILCFIKEKMLIANAYKNG